MFLCLDPKGLNATILLEHYPLSTIEDAATDLHGQKSSLHWTFVTSKFWLISYDVPSSFLAIFYTSLG